MPDPNRLSPNAAGGLRVDGGAGDNSPANSSDPPSPTTGTELEISTLQQTMDTDRTGTAETGDSTRTYNAFSKNSNTQGCQVQHGPLGQALGQAQAGDPFVQAVGVGRDGRPRKFKKRGHDTTATA